MPRRLANGVLLLGLLTTSAWRAAASPMAHFPSPTMKSQIDPAPQASSEECGSEVHGDGSWEVAWTDTAGRRRREIRRPAAGSARAEGSANAAARMPGAWQRLPDYPLAPGMAGLVAGAHGGVLIAAGGANFPDRMPWEGGRKIYYDQIFVLRPGDAGWRAAGTLPEARAYAAVVSLPEGVLLAGGENADRILGDTLWLRWDGDRVVIARGPNLPAPTTSPVAAALNGRVYLAGGYAPGAARESRGDFWSLDLSEPAADWRSLTGWPGPPRAQAVMAALNGAVYLLSGLEMAVGPEGKPQPNYLRDAYRYRTASGWERLPDLPWSAIAAPSPAPVTSQPARIFVLGGVDGRQVGKVPRATRVPADVVYFDVSLHGWRLWPEQCPDPVVTTPAVEYGGKWIFVSGEIMAGVRTTSAWGWQAPEAR